ncbi:hypothetical protein MAM1_0170d07143 [Mucor ambiguus]|uniref:Uncharacterized protein n=1 Tax=Mucor ambiguus TaxID=91626 RepID=A0A0C9MAS1_9FUNG|nr:hypothetical protein MAM1_0170d07143 [Mucor ambiguus]
MVCCRPADVDQNEGPPPPSTTATQAATIAADTEHSQQQIIPHPAQFTVEASTGFAEEQLEPIEEDWGDEEPEPSPYKPEDFVVEEDEYDKYEYDPSPFKEFDDVQKAFEDESRIYEKPNTVDVNTIWGNREYERSIRNWDIDQMFNATPTRAQVATR